VAAWLAEAAAAVEGRGAAATVRTLDELRRAWDQAYPPGETLVATRDDGVPVALARVRATPGRLVIDALTVRADARNRGHGQAIVFLLERARAAPGSLAAAGVPRTNGLAVYFWLRAGYRPLYPRPADAPSDLDPSRLWMVRRL
jgi:ribosomal protein S18 acetylase RimI-like enzyme